MKAVNRIKELRTSRKMTQKELAGKLNLSQSHIAMLENGERSLDMELMDKISRELGVKPYELLPKEWQPDDITPEEREILRMIRKTTPSQTKDSNDIHPQTKDEANLAQQKQPSLKTNER